MAKIQVKTGREMLWGISSFSYLWVRYCLDSIEVQPRAEGLSSTLDNEAFAICPVLQLGHLFLQIHHHTAWEGGTALFQQSNKLRCSVPWLVSSRERQISTYKSDVQYQSLLTGEGVHAGGVVDGQDSYTRVLFEQVNGASRKSLQLFSDLHLVEAMDVGVNKSAALSLQQPWRKNINTAYEFCLSLNSVVIYLIRCVL